VSWVDEVTHFASAAVGPVKSLQRLPEGFCDEISICIIYSFSHKALPNLPSAFGK
jgi:hypothetical protein